MHEMHSLGAWGESQAALEKVGEGFVLDGLIRAQAKSWEALSKIRDRIEPGMTEPEGRKLALEVMNGMGASRHWHQPHVRFGPGTCLIFSDPLQPEYRVKVGDPFFMDLGPVWPASVLFGEGAPEVGAGSGGLEYEGDCGATFVLGGPEVNPAAERCRQTARELFDLGVADRIRDGLDGESIYTRMIERARERGYDLLVKAGGHRVSEFPHHRYTKKSINEVRFAPSRVLWILEVQIVDRARGFGAFYEDHL